MLQKQMHNKKEPYESICGTLFQQNEKYKSIKEQLRCQYFFLNAALLSRKISRLSFGSGLRMEVKKNLIGTSIFNIRCYDFDLKSMIHFLSPAASPACFLPHPGLFNRCYKVSDHIFPVKLFQGQTESWLISTVFHIPPLIIQSFPCFPIFL